MLYSICSLAFVLQKHVAKNYGESEHFLHQLHTCSAFNEPSSRGVCRLQEQRLEIQALGERLETLLRLDAPSCYSGHCWPRCAIFRHHSTRGHVADALARTSREVAALVRLFDRVAPHGNAGCTPREPVLPSPTAACSQRDFLRASLETIACTERSIASIFT